MNDSKSINKCKARQLQDKSWNAGLCVYTALAIATDRLTMPHSDKAL